MNSSHARGSRRCRTAARAGGSTAAGGFVLLETLIAVTLLAGVLVSLAELLAFSVRIVQRTRSTTTATVLARQKVEQLRGLCWRFARDGSPVSDTAADTASTGAGCPVSFGGAGVGLTTSPTDSLARDEDGYVDYVDRWGCVMGGGGGVPQGAVFVRRWSVEAVPWDPDHTIVVQVRVMPLGRAPGGRARVPFEARLISVVTRTQS